MSDTVTRKGSSPRRAAFFDLDETLIKVKSMFRFLEFHLARRGLPGAVYERIRADLDALSSAGWTRRETNRAYYQVYKHQSADRLAAHGEEWFAGELAGADLFVTGVFEALRRHQRQGDLTVLVSGSFPPCIDPVARYVRADLVMCTRPEIVDGHYTGRVENPVIGQAKADAVHEVLSRYRLAAADCFAYGDHASDLPMLRSVGHPVVVGEDPVLDVVARDSRWARIPHACGDLVTPAAE
jgi:HAD superfamily hydrolase (TIGR01490 family)